MNAYKQKNKILQNQKKTLFFQFYYLLNFANLRLELINQREIN